MFTVQYPASKFLHEEFTVRLSVMVIGVLLMIKIIIDQNWTLPGAPTITNCCLFYITVSLLFSVTIFSAYLSTVNKKKGYVVLGILHLLSFW